jgi:hypothetical protein
METITKSEALIAIKVIEYMAEAKKEQLLIEPNVKIWRDEWRDLDNTLNQIKSDLEFFNDTTKSSV